MYDGEVPPPFPRFKGGVKVRKFKALYRFEGYVVEELICEEAGARKAESILSPGDGHPLQWNALDDT